MLNPVLSGDAGSHELDNNLGIPDKNGLGIFVYSPLSFSHGDALPNRYENDQQEACTVGMGGERFRLGSQHDNRCFYRIVFWLFDSAGFVRISLHVRRVVHETR